MRTTILALHMVVSSSFLFAGCVPPMDSTPSDFSYQHDPIPPPSLPDVVVLYDDPYYSYSGYT